MTPIIRRLQKSSSSEIELVATRMRETLIEVLGVELGSSYYSMDWLIRRVLYHLDPQQCDGEVMLLESDGQVIAHCIVRQELDADGSAYGLFSTSYVLPEHRQKGIATMLLKAGETWMQSRGLRRAATNTGIHNSKLISLYKKHGYRVIFTQGEMLQLSRELLS